MRQLNSLFILFIISLLAACDAPEKTAASVIDATIEAHGGAAFDSLEVEFTFRKKAYLIDLDKGNYRYERSWTDSIGEIRDVLTNDGFKRFIDSQPIGLSKKDSSIYANALNSVQYFALLPYGLQQEAVIPTLLEEQVFGEDKYYVVQVRFTEENGGEDFEDVFCYWVNQESMLVDYLAYQYHTNGGGARFREAFNRVEKEGVVFQDYKNYKAPLDTSIASYLTLFKKDELALLSTISLELND